MWIFVCETEKHKWRDIVERLGALALRAAAVCGDAVLSFCHWVAQFIPPGPSYRDPTEPEEVKFCQLKPLFWNDAWVCWNFVAGRIIVLPDLSSMYKGFKSLKDILQRQVQPPRDHPLSGETPEARRSSWGNRGIVSDLVNVPQQDSMFLV